MYTCIIGMSQFRHETYPNVLVFYFYFYLIFWQKILLFNRFVNVHKRDSIVLILNNVVG